MHDQQKLSRREKDILAFICNGYTNTDISRILKLSINTVKAHTQHIYQKLDVSNRTEAAIWWQNETEEKTSFSYPDLIFDNDVENFIHDTTCPSDKDFLTQLQSKMIELLSAKELFTIRSNIQPDMDGYLIHWHVQEEKPSFIISVSLESYPKRQYIWKGHFSAKKKIKSIQFLSSQIVSSLTYQLIEREIHNVLMAPTDKTLYQNLILSFHLLNQSTPESIDQAKTTLDAILCISPNCIAALYNRSIASYLSILTNNSQNLDADTAAIAMYCKKSTQLCRNHARSYYIRGLYLLLQKKIPEGIHMFEKSIAIDDSFQGGYLILAQLYTLIQNIPAAEKNLAYALALCPEYKYKGNNLLSIGMIFLLLKKYEKATRFLEENFCISENHPLELLLYACALHQSGNIVKAAEIAKKVTITEAYLQILLQFFDKKSAISIRNIIEQSGIEIQKQ